MFQALDQGKSWEMADRMGMEYVFFITEQNHRSGLKTPENPHNLNRKIDGFQCRLPLKPIH